MQTIISEQYGMTADHLAVWLARLNPEQKAALSESGVRKQIERWKSAGTVHCEQLLGRTWVTLTSRGQARVGSTYPVWAMPVTRLAHVHAVNAVRLALAADVRYRWVSERALLALRQGGTWHIGDAALLDGDGSPLDTPHRLVEVELTPKSRQRYSAEVLSRLSRNVTALDYYVAPHCFERVRDDLSAVIRERHPRLAVEVNVEPLPALAAPVREGAHS